MSAKFLFLLFLCFLPSYTEYNADVVGVVDGDTIDIVSNGKQIRIRLNGIDCPEKSQPYGSKAKMYTSGLVYGKKVLVKTKEIDRYGRTIADIYLEDGTWLNKAILNAGYGWHYKRYSSDQELAQAEEMARKQRIGLWQDTEPVEPWVYRKR